MAEIDVYDYLLQGKNTQDIRLEDGDVIVVSPYQNLVELTGRVKRPMIYELKDEENMEQLLSYAGGFRGMPIKRHYGLFVKVAGNIRFIMWMRGILTVLF